MEPLSEETLAFWVIDLKAARKSPETIKSYTAGPRELIKFLEANDLPVEITKRGVQAFVADLLEQGRQPATARARLLGIKRFSAWLTEDGTFDDDPVASIKPPKLDAKVVEPLTDDQLRALLKACEGRDFMDLRDNAIVRLMLETGIRAGECVALEVGDVDLINGTVIVRRGKGGKGRAVPIGPRATKAVADYIRKARSGHKLANRPDLWLGTRQRGFTYDALYKVLEGRACVAGIADFHPHRLRHTAAHRWLAAGGSEGGLMAVAGWTRPEMLQRYTKARAEDRAAAEARALNLGDI